MMVSRRARIIEDGAGKINCDWVSINIVGTKRALRTGRDAAARTGIFAVISHPLGGYASVQWLTYNKDIRTYVHHDEHPQSRYGLGQPG